MQVVVVEVLMGALMVQVALVVVAQVVLHLLLEQQTEVVAVAELEAAQVRQHQLALMVVLA
jgi:hypothetical protein